MTGPQSDWVNVDECFRVGVVVNSGKPARHLAFLRSPDGMNNDHHTRENQSGADQCL